MTSSFSCNFNLNIKFKSTLSLFDFGYNFFYTLQSSEHFPALFPEKWLPNLIAPKVIHFNTSMYLCTSLMPNHLIIYLFHESPSIFDFFCVSFDSICYCLLLIISSLRLFNSCLFSSLPCNFCSDCAQLRERGNLASSIGHLISGFP